MNKYKAIDLLDGKTNLYEVFDAVYDNLKAAADSAGQNFTMRDAIATILHNGFRVVYDNPEQIEYISTMFHSGVIHANPVHNNSTDVCDFLPRLCGMVSNITSIDGDPELYERYTFYDFCYISYILCSSVFPAFYGEDDGDSPSPQAVCNELVRIWHEIQAI